MAEMSYGPVLTLSQAAQLGVLEGAEALKRDSENEPWTVVMPVDCPVEQDGDGDDQASAQGDVMTGNVSLYRALRHLHKGGLHRALGVPEGKPIPQDKLESAKNSDNSHVAHMARFASVLEGFHHKKDS